MIEIKNKILKYESVEWKKLVFIQTDTFKKLKPELLEKLKESLIENNFIENFKVWQHNDITYCLDGFHRIKALTEIETFGHKGKFYKIPDKFPAAFIDCKDREEASRLVLIYSSQYAKIDETEFIEFIKLENLDISFINKQAFIDGIDFDKIILDLKGKEIGEEKLNEIPKILKKPFSKMQDVFELDNKHRVMCGDSTIEADVKMLMNNKKADMVFTDPPYGVNYSAKNEFLNKLDKGNRIQIDIKNDVIDEDAFELWGKSFEHLKIILSDYHSIYICSPQTRDLMMMMMMIEKGGIYISSVIIWVKNNHVLGRMDYNSKHETIIYGWLKKGKHKFYGNGEQKTSVWNYNKPLKNDLHPTMKPIALIQNAIMNSKRKQYCSRFISRFRFNSDCLRANKPNLLRNGT